MLCSRSGSPCVIAALETRMWSSSHIATRYRRIVVSAETPVTRRIDHANSRGDLKSEGWNMVFFGAEGGLPAGGIYGSEALQRISGGGFHLRYTPPLVESR